MKQLLFAVFAVALVVVPGVVSAAPAPASSGFDVTSATTTDSGLSGQSIYALVTTFMNWLLGLIGVLAVIAFVISGILYLTAAGDEGQIEKAKGVMMYAIVGLVVALIGLIIVNAVSGLMGNTTGGSF